MSKMLSNKQVIDIVGINKPFIYKDIGSNDENICVIHKIAAHYFLRWPQENPVHQIPMFLNHNFGKVELIDWIEDNLTNESKICTCDLQKVIMVTGCQCGGI